MNNILTCYGANIAGLGADGAVKLPTNKQTKKQDYVGMPREQLEIFRVPPVWKSLGTTALINKK